MITEYLYFQVDSKGNVFIFLDETTDNWKYGDSFYKYEYLYQLVAAEIGPGIPIKRLAITSGVEELPVFMGNT